MDSGDAQITTVMKGQIGVTPSADGLALGGFDTGGHRIADALIATERIGQGRLFLATLPDSAALARVELSEAGVVLASITTQASPLISIQSPVAGMTYATNVPIRWTATNASGVQYLLQYSLDDGLTWLSCAYGVSGNTFDWDVRSLPGSTVARIRIVPLSSFAPTFATSSSFVLAPGDPTVRITGQREVSVLRPGWLTLYATALDPVDGPFPADRIIWSSDREGNLGSGSTISIDTRRLSIGRHVITCSVTNNRGGTVIDQVSVTVGEVGRRRAVGH
jgi:hypothetical protein